MTVLEQMAQFIKDGTPFSITFDKDRPTGLYKTLFEISILGKGIRISRRIKDLE